MNTSFITSDFSYLLEPISQKNPAGKNLREDASLLAAYQEIKDARTTARTIEREKIQAKEKTIQADWRIVQKLAIQILSTQSKDLEIATWLIEALLREFGFNGLSDGFKLTRELCVKFWDTLYPLPDEDGVISRVIYLTGLNGENRDGVLITPIALVSLTEEKKTTPYALWHYYQALDLLKIIDPDKRALRISSGAVTLEMIENALKKSSSNFLQAQYQALNSCITEYQLLIHLLEEKCGPDVPPSSRILLQLNTCIDCLSCVSTREVTEAGKISSLEKNITPEIFRPYADFKKENISLREEMLQKLLQAADFFRITEPHSPLPYLLERAVRWAKIPLPLLLAELIADEDIRGKVGNLTGITFDQ